MIVFKIVFFFIFQNGEPVLESCGAGDYICADVQSDLSRQMSMWSG